LWGLNPDKKRLKAESASLFVVNTVFWPSFTPKSEV